MIAACVVQNHLVFGFCEVDIERLCAGLWQAADMLEECTIVVCHKDHQPDPRNFVGMIPPIIMLNLTDPGIDHMRQRKNVLIDQSIPGVGDLRFKLFWRPNQEEVLTDLKAAFPWIDQLPRDSYRPDTLPSRDLPI